MLKGCITALVTPMFEDGSIDWESLDSLVEWQVQNGVSGLVANGSTGEAANLATKETIDVIERIIKKAAGRVKIVVGAGTASTATSVAFIEKVNQISGIDYLMLLTPYYVKPTQGGLYKHFAELTNASKFPVILYNVPGRTGANIEDDTIIKLATDFPKVVGLKDATGDLQRCFNIVSRMPEGFSLLSGDDLTVLPFMMLGGTGVISVVSNARPREMSELCRYALEGDRKNAIRMNNILMPTYTSFFWESNPIPVKWALYHEGKIKTPELRMPLTAFSEKFHASFEDVLSITNLN